MGPLTDLIKQNSARITATLSNMESISGQIASGQGTVGKVIYRGQLYDSAMSTVTNLQDAVDLRRNNLSTASAAARARSANWPRTTRSTIPPRPR